MEKYEKRAAEMHKEMSVLQRTVKTLLEEAGDRADDIEVHQDESSYYEEVEKPLVIREVKELMEKIEKGDHEEPEKSSENGEDSDLD